MGGSFLALRAMAFKSVAMGRLQFMSSTSFFMAGLWRFAGEAALATMVLGWDLHIFETVGFNFGDGRW